MEIPYTRDRSAFFGWVLGWCLLFSVEGLVVVTLIMVFVPGIWLKLALTGIFLALLGWPITSLFRPLRTSHRLDKTSLTLRYGSTRIDIPRTSITGAVIADDRTGSAYVGQPAVDAASGSVRLTFSRLGQIRLDLDPPVDVRVGKSVISARQILFNADNREEVLQALQGPGSPDITADPIPRRLRVPQLMNDVDERQIAIEAMGLSRSFGGVRVVDEIGLHVHAGEIYGFIGPNGAGKTTTISMLVGLLAPTEGIVRIAGHDLAINPVAAKQALGYVPDRPILYETLTGRENLEFIAQMRGLARYEARTRIDELLSALDLAHRADELCRTYSFGMRNKLSLAAAMLHRPSVLILDEPFNGLDPQTSYSLRSLIIDQARDGTGVLLSTHDLALVERMCHRVGVLDRGRLIAEGDPNAIRHKAGDLEAAFLTLTGGGASG